MENMLSFGLAPEMYAPGGSLFNPKGLPSARDPQYAGMPDDMYKAMMEYNQRVGPNGMMTMDVKPWQQWMDDQRQQQQAPGMMAPTQPGMTPAEQLNTPSFEQLAQNNPVQTPAPITMNPQDVYNQYAGTMPNMQAPAPVTQPVPQPTQSPPTAVAQPVTQPPAPAIQPGPTPAQSPPINATQKLVQSIQRPTRPPVPMGPGRTMAPAPAPVPRATPFVRPTTPPAPVPMGPGRAMAPAPASKPKLKSTRC